MRDISLLGGTTGAVTIAVIAGVYEYRRRPNPAIPALLTLTVLGQFLIVNIIKLIVDRDRPDIRQLTGFSGASFPSGHAAAAAATFAVVGLLAGRGRSRTVRNAIAGAVVGLAILVAASRVMLGVHWLTDVIAGIAVGWAWLAVCSIAFGGRLVQFGAPVTAATAVAEADRSTTSRTPTPTPTRTRSVVANRSDIRRWTERVEAQLARRYERRRAASGSRPPDPSLPIGTDTLPQIRHIVVLMMENHSFDNYLGLLGRGDGLDVDANGLPTASNPRQDGRLVRSHKLPATAQTPGVPTQGWEPSHEQWAAGANQGFVRSAEHREQQLDDDDTDPAIAMGYWTDADLPFYWGLARQFPLADRWFSSCLGPTFPNRRFLIAGTANGLTSDSVSHTFDRPANGTLFDLLDTHHISWANYHPIPHRGPLAKRDSVSTDFARRAMPQPS